jgi:uncharacterized membrane protein
MICCRCSFVAAIIWFTQRQRSAYVRFHSLQALCYHVISLWAFTWLMPLLLGGLVVLAVFGILLLGPETLDDETAGLLFSLGVQAIVWGVLLAAFGLYALVGLIGALQPAGREFRYRCSVRPWQAWLFGTDSEIRRQDDRLPAVAPPAIHDHVRDHPAGRHLDHTEKSGPASWFSIRRRVSSSGALATSHGATCFGRAFAGYGILGALAGVSNLTVLLLILTPMLCFLFLIAVGGPTFHLFSIIASLRVLRGHDYKYPLLGRYLHRRMQPPAAGPGLTQV